MGPRDHGNILVPLLLPGVAVGGLGATLAQRWGAGAYGLAFANLICSAVTVFLPWALILLYQRYRRTRTWPKPLVFDFVLPDRVVGPHERCPYCLDLLAALLMVECSACRAVFHEECLAETNGCTTLGCTARRERRIPC